MWTLSAVPFASKGFDVGRLENALDSMWQDSHKRAKRFKDPPPNDVKGDQDYVPEAGEWFWWWRKDRGKWVLRKGMSDGNTVDSEGNDTGHKFRTYCKHRESTAEKRLPATGP